MRQLFWALLVLSAYAGAEDDVPNYDFRVFPPGIMRPEYEDSVRYAGKQYDLCDETFITAILESEGVLDDIKAQVSDKQRGYRSDWAIKDNRLFLTSFNSVSEAANQHIRQLIADHQGYLAADWYTGDVYLGDTEVMFSACTFQHDADLKKFSIAGGQVFDVSDIRYEDYMQAMREIINLDELFKAYQKNQSKYAIQKRKAEANRDAPD